VADLERAIRSVDRRLVATPAHLRAEVLADVRDSLVHLREVFEVRRHETLVRLVDVEGLEGAAARIGASTDEVSRAIERQPRRRQVSGRHRGD